MRLILANLFIFGALAFLYYSDIFAAFNSKYVSWFTTVLIISIFIIGFKIMGSPFNLQDNDDDNDDNTEDSDKEDGEAPTRKKSNKS